MRGKNDYTGLPGYQTAVRADRGQVPDADFERRVEPNSRMPSVRSLAVELSINPNTIQRAYSELERTGFIYSKRKGQLRRLQRQSKGCPGSRKFWKKLRDLKKEALGMGMTVKGADRVSGTRGYSCGRAKRDQSPGSGMRGNMIELKNVSKSFDGIEALKNVSVTVREGEVFGLIGTNGAGKSTLLRLACGYLSRMTD